MRRLIFLTASLALSACATGATISDPEMQWSYARGEAPDKTRLIHGLPDTDIVDVGFFCDAGSGQAKLVLFENEPPLPPVTLRSGPAALTLSLSPSPYDEVMDMEGPVAVSSGVAQAFAQTGILFLLVGSKRLDLTARTPQERTETTTFWRTCGR